MGDEEERPLRMKVMTVMMMKSTRRKRRKMTVIMANLMSFLLKRCRTMHWTVLCENIIYFNEIIVIIDYHSLGNSRLTNEGISHRL